MATKPSTIEFILEQLQDAGEVSARKMFGEYALYCNGRVVALVCDDTLFVKITDAGRALVGPACPIGPAYPGARDSFIIDDDRIEEREWLSELIRTTAQQLPLPKAKKKTK